MLVVKKRSGTTGTQSSVRIESERFKSSRLGRGPRRLETVQEGQSGDELATARAHLWRNSALILPEYVNRRR